MPPKKPNPQKSYADTTSLTPTREYNMAYTAAAVAVDVEVGKVLATDATAFTTAAVLVGKLIAAEMNNILLPEL